MADAEVSNRQGPDDRARRLGTGVFTGADQQGYKERQSQDRLEFAFKVA